LLPDLSVGICGFSLYRCYVLRSQTRFIAMHRCMSDAGDRSIYFQESDHGRAKEG
jgi:hypothetical protein